MAVVATARNTARDSHSVAAFVTRRSGYYELAFRRIQEARGVVWSFNVAAAILGPVWAGARGVWTFFWVAAFAELFACIQIGRGWFGELGGDALARSRKLHEASLSRLAEAESASGAGRVETAETFTRVAANLQQASDQALAQAQHAAAGASSVLLAGIGMLLAVKFSEGLFANWVYERQYTAWRVDKRVPSGLRLHNVALGLFLLAVMYPLTVYRFTATRIPDFLAAVPVSKAWFAIASSWLDDAIDAIYRVGGGGFDTVRDVIRLLVGALETVLVGTPWPVVMVVLMVVAWRRAGRRVALLTAGSIVYLAVLGMWELAMQTVALLGTAAVLCIGCGIPLGVWLSRSERAYAMARPVLDLMQTMPAMVYLIPAIAFFGTGTPPGIVATLIFGMPPVVRLTALGLQQVPQDIKEAARAYGASQWQLLVGVELPLARPAIMSGVNQTILMCLSMVVIAALIGAQGLGSVVLEALQFAASGQGILAGVAILLCAIVIDRIVQGAFRAAGDGNGKQQGPAV